MIIVSVILMSAIDGQSTELARMGIDNASGGGRVRDYNTRTWRGRDTDALNRAMIADTVTRKGKVEGHRSLDLHVWHLVAKALTGMGYGEATEAMAYTISCAKDVAFDPAKIREFVHDGDGFWRGCSGCHELIDGYPTGDYSEALDCHIGNGCRECGGLGAIWDDTDYGAMAEAMLGDEMVDEEETERRLIVAYMRHMATLRPADANGLRVIASDVEAMFHHDAELNPVPVDEDSTAAQ